MIAIGFEKIIKLRLMKEAQFVKMFYIASFKPEKHVTEKH